MTIEGWTYGETANAPVPSSASNGTNIVTYLYESTDEGVSYSSSTAPTDAGNYKLTATFAATDTHETGTATCDFTIQKADPTPNDFDCTLPTDAVYDGKAQTVSATATDGVTGMGEITVKYYSDPVMKTEAQPKDAGLYYVGVITAEGDNYSAAEEPISLGSFEIAPQPITAPTAQSGLVMRKMIHARPCATSCLRALTQTP